MYKEQIATLHKENLAHIASLETKINSQVSRIQELEALGLEATKHLINIDPEVEREALALEIARRDEVIN